VTALPWAVMEARRASITAHGASRIIPT